jgi:C-3',4' desaturase CrtD
VGGLTVAAVLSRVGLDVTVLEAQVYPGGCASTFFHQGFHFDTGATLAGGFYPGGPMHQVAQAAGIDAWPSRSINTTMLVHLPGGVKIPRRADDSRWGDIRAAFGRPGMEFFHWQEKTADILWDLTLRLPPWPPQNLKDLRSGLATSTHWLIDGAFTRVSPTMALDAIRPVASHLRHASEDLRLFVDAQLLISAQAESHHANALYGAAALDLPRRGVVHLTGGMGAIAGKLVEAVNRNGGRVHFRQEASRIRIERGHPVAVETRRGASFPADIIFTNLTPWNAANLFADQIPAALRHLPPLPVDGWGAFMVYIGLDGAVVQPNAPLHHQIIQHRPLGEGNSVFASLSPEWDTDRAPAGHRALTLSTHTKLDRWWNLYEHDRPAYEAQKTKFTTKLISATETALPGLRETARLVMPGTPVTFQRFTRRTQGWVGGFPQTSLLRNFRPRLAPNIYLVGDSIFPGQSTAAVALGGLRVAKMALTELGIYSTNPGFDMGSMPEASV